MHTIIKEFVYVVALNSNEAESIFAFFMKFDIVQLISLIQFNRKCTKLFTAYCKVFDIQFIFKVW